MKKVTGWGFVAVFVWFALGGIYADEEMGQEKYAARAVQSVKEGKQAEALADFNKAVELAPDKPIHYRNRAAFFSLTKQWDKAIADYDTLLKLEKDDPPMRPNRGTGICKLDKLRK